MELEEAYRYCQKLAGEHYENFPVASALLPRKLRPHVAAIYAFARIADDFADEEANLEKLLHWRQQLFRSLQGEYSHPVFRALHHTIRKFDLPVSWLDDLLTAFRQDLEKNRYFRFSELLEYTRYSANPVGRIVLWLFGYREPKLMEYADQITTGLQLVNFWQDLSVDIPRNRLYIPREWLEKWDIKEDDILRRVVSPHFPELMREVYYHTVPFFHRGRRLLPHLSGRLKMEIKLTVAGGMAILDKTLLLGNNILFYRPKLNKIDWIRLIVKTFIAF